MKNNMATAMEEDNSHLLQAADTINSIFGSDVKNLSKAEDLYNEYAHVKSSVESQLNFATTKAPGKIDSAVTEADTLKKKIIKCHKDKELLCGEIDNFVADVNPMVKKLSTLTGQVKELERYSVYIQMIGKIEDFSSDIQSALIISSADRAVTSFSLLADLTKTIQGSNCLHLVRFSNETVVYWYKILKEKFTTEFEEVLAAYRWPFTVSTTKTPTIQNANEVRAKLDPLFINLLHLQLPPGLSTEGQPANPFMADLPGWRPLPLPLQLMVKPLRKRFRYHFYGKKQTNSIDKSEWYLTQILTWIRDHQEFLSTRVQPLLEKAGLQSVDAVTEFSRGVTVLAIEKMLCDVPEAIYDEHTFSHLVDEALAFDRELRTGYGYPASQPGVLSVITQPEPFSKWIHVEKKFAQERMDAMLASETAWRSQYKDLTDVDDTKVPECGESFMTLMLTITDRYKPLPVVSCKLRFLELQLEMLDDYRVRLVQVKAEENNNPLGQIFTAILNTVAYIVSVLREWSELVFFLQLQYYKVQEQQARLRNNTISSPVLPSDTPDPSDKRRSVSCSAVRHDSVDSQVSTDTLDEASLAALEGCVFDEIIQLLEHMRNEMLNNIVRYVTDDIKARSRPYRKDKWISLPSQKDFVTLTLSPSACDMLLVLKDRLHLLQQVLAKQMLTSAWQMVATSLDTFIYEEVILANNFNDGGASQLNFDMTRNLFPLFGQYTHRPENYFKRTREACILLTLNVGSGLLLKDVLYRALHEPGSDRRDQAQDPVATLRDLNVYNLSPDDAELVLSLRTDFTT